MEWKDPDPISHKLKVIILSCMDFFTVQSLNSKNPCRVLDPDA
jgi:hypothetical protein